MFGGYSRACVLLLLPRGGLVLQIQAARLRHLLRVGLFFGVGSRSLWSLIRLWSAWGIWSPGAATTAGLQPLLARRGMSES